MATILIAESGDALETTVGHLLREDGHVVIRVPIEKVLEERASSADLVLLGAPDDLDRGRELVGQLSGQNRPIVVAILPAGLANAPAMRALFLKAGASDCLSAPLGPSEVLARIEARLPARESMKKLLARCGFDVDTGIYSQSLFERRLAEEHMKAARYPMPLSCLLVRLDDFEGLQARHGGSFRRTVLRETALLIQNSLRLSDFVAYCGPAEFGVLLPFTNATDALVCAERIRGRAEVFPFRHERITANATVSIGVAGYSAKRTPEPASLLQEAQICLDFARRHGGNQVVADEVYMAGPMQGAVSCDSLIDHLRGGDELAQMRAYHALREAGDRAIPALLRALQDPKPDVRRYCVCVLGTVAAKNAASAILPLMKDLDRDVRVVAAWALGRLGDAAGVPVLIDAITDADAQVRAAAALSIATLTGNSLRPNVDKTAQELRAEADACRKRWQEKAGKG